MEREGRRVKRARGNKTASIEPYQDRVAAWAGEGKSVRQVTALLREEGLDVDPNAVYRFCQRAGIVFANKPGPKPRPNDDDDDVMPPDVRPPRQGGTSAIDLFGPAPQTPKDTTKAESHPTASRPAPPPPEPAPDPPPDLSAQLVIPGYPSAVVTHRLPDLPPSSPPGIFETVAWVDAPPKSPPSPPTGKPAAQSPPPSPGLPRRPTTAVPPFVPPGPWRPPPLPFVPDPPVPVWTPDLPLVCFGEAEEEQWTLQDACEGTFVLGMTGSGKTSGSGRTIAGAFLNSGFGGLVLTVKKDEAQFWERLCAQYGRSHHLCVVRAGGQFAFNFLDHETRRPGGDTDDRIEDLVNLFYTVMEVGTRQRRTAGQEAFWVDSGKALIRNTLRILAYSRPTLHLRDMLTLIKEAPTSLAAVENGSWQGTPFFGPCVEEAYRCTRERDEAVAIMGDEARFYWLDTFPRMYDGTRASLITAFSALIDAFFTPQLYRLFCQETTLVPEAACDGAIIVLDLPLLRLESVGLFAQAVWKHLFQKMLERRDDRVDASRRPVFLWVDEAQYFCSEHDQLFQSTARSAGCATVYLTQSISGLYAAYGGQKYAADALLTNLTTKIFHANNDPASNSWAAEQIGSDLTYRFSTNQNASEPGKMTGGGVSSGFQEHMDFEVQPGEFTRLATGSKRYAGLVEAYFIKSGKTFPSTGKHYFKTVFRQEGY